MYSSRAAIPCVIGWAREQQERMAGLRTFALDAIAGILRGGLYGLQGIQTNVVCPGTNAASGSNTASLPRR